MKKFYLKNANVLNKYRNELGENILWDPKLKKILWTNIPHKQFHICSLDGNDHKIIYLPSRLCSFARTSKDNLICAFEDRVVISNYKFNKFKILLLEKRNL